MTQWGRILPVCLHYLIADGGQMGSKSGVGETGGVGSVGFKKCSLRLEFG